MDAYTIHQYMTNLKPHLRAVFFFAQKHLDKSVVRKAYYIKKLPTVNSKRGTKCGNTFLPNQLDKPIQSSRNMAASFCPVSLAHI